MHGSRDTEEGVADLMIDNNIEPKLVGERDKRGDNTQWRECQGKKSTASEVAKTSHVGGYTTAKQS